MKQIYLDYASLTPIDRNVMREMKKYSTPEYGNPSALYASGLRAKKALLDAKKRIAGILHIHPDEIIFTSGGTESNERVLKAFPPGSIVTSAIEHSSIMHNQNVIQIPVDEKGVINLDCLRKTISRETKLVSVMLVNNEIGTIEPIHEVAKIVREVRKKNNSIYPLLHTDASQAIYLALNVEKLGVDLMTLDGQKIYGPRGIGMLYVKRGTVNIPRPGTENLPGIMGFAQALELGEKIREKEYIRLTHLKDFLLSELVKINSRIRVNGDIKNSTPHILNISIPGIDSEYFVVWLGARGIECSTKSACLYDEDESYVLKNIGGDSTTSLRFSFGRDTTRSQLKKVLKCVTIYLTTYHAST